MAQHRRKELAVRSMWADLQQQALQMRRAQTAAEDRLWQELRGGELGGFRFRRQHPIGRFIVDFYSVQAALVIEVNGGVHATQAAADHERTRILEAMGLIVIRFSNEQVMADIEGVIDSIKREMPTNSSETQLPSPRKERGRG